MSNYWEAPPPEMQGPVEDVSEFESRVVPFSQLYREAIHQAHKPLPADHVKGFPMLSDICGGFRPNEYSILCGATGTGKTTTLANWSKGLMINRVPHAVFSVETGPHDYIRRVMSAFSGVNINLGDAVPAGTLEELDRKYGDVLTQAGNLLALYEDRFSTKILMREIELTIKRNGTRVVFVDNLNFFLESSTGERQNELMDRVTHELVIFSKSHPVHIVMVMHPRKTDDGRVESEFDIKGSSTAVQEAHNVFLFNTPHPDLIKADIARPYMREIKLQKCRRKGIKVGSRLLMLVDGNGSRYQEYGVYYRDRFDRSPEAPPVPGKNSGNQRLL